MGAEVGDVVTCEVVGDVAVSSLFGKVVVVSTAIVTLHYSW